jgi:hypothetical protein
MVSINKKLTHINYPESVLKVKNFLVKTRVLIAILTVLAVLTLPVSAEDGLSLPREFFPEAGHWVIGEFLEYFKSHGGLAIFGYPLTEPYYEDGILIQYFQNARMEWHINADGSYSVQLGHLGEELNYSTPGIAEPARRESRKAYFSETGHKVSYAFLDFFEQNGGVDLFGLPITEMYFEGDTIVQYFQNMKLIWDPALSRIRVAELGTVYVTVFNNVIPDTFEKRIDTDADLPAALDIVVELGDLTISSQKSQAISVLVLDEGSHDPITGVEVRVKLYRAGGEDIEGDVLSAVTDKNGRANIEVLLSGINPSAWITVRAEVLYRGVEGIGENFFLVRR